MTLTKRDNRIAAGICILLCALVWLVFGQTLKHGFVNYDDEKYVYKNAHITPGLTINGIDWAFTQPHADNWHPLTFISHMLDCQLFGLKPSGHHFTNVLLHTAAVVSLFLVLRSMTGALWRSAFVAALFAIHPLRVESVAWVAERKDVLSGLFFMLTLGAYVGYARKPSIGRYLLVAGLFALGLMAKPMLVTLPIVLLLLDYWPLGRFAPLPLSNPVPTRCWAGQPIALRLFLEKIPLMVLSAASCVATLVAQRRSIEVIGNLSLPWRIGNACVTVFTYLLQFVWPAKLAVFYPHPKESLPFLAIMLSVGLLVAISTLALGLRRTRPYLFTGWFWYLIMLVPVVGIVQVGLQGHADRYTYLPHIGLYLLCTWAVVEISAKWPRRREILSVGAALIISALTWQAWRQTSYWRDSESLWSHALAVTSRNDVAHNNLGTLRGRSGRTTEAISEFQKALEINPELKKANYNLAGAFLQNGQIEQAIAHYEKELQIQPDYADAENNLGHALLQAGRIEEAIAHFRKFAELRPNSATAHYNLAIGLHQTRRLDEAIFQYEAALALKPDYPDARQNLDKARQGNGL